MLKIAVSSYSFSQYLNDGRMTLIDCISKAKEMGFDGIEFTDANGPMWDGNDLSAADKYRAESERIGIPIVSYDISANLAENFPEKSPNEIERIKRQVDFAAALGVPCMRHDATFGGEGWDIKSEAFFDEVLPVLADACREITEYAATKGVRTMVENHGLFCQDSHRVEKLMKAVNHPNFGWLMDIGNFMCADEECISACKTACKYAFHVHTKDFYHKQGADEAGNYPDGKPDDSYFQTRGGNYLKGAITGEGVVPVKGCLETLKTVNYSGFISIEFEGAEDSLEGIAKGRENVTGFLK